MYRTRQLNAWLSIPKRNDRATSRIVLFPYAGGGPTAFYQWAAPLLDQFEVVMVNLPGREARGGEALSTDWRTVSEGVAEALDAIGGLPFAFFGHSLGALLAYETCRAARARGGPAPYLLMTSARAAAQIALKRAPYYHLPREPFFAELLKLGGIAPEIMELPALLDYIEPILRADLELHDRYQHAPGPALAQPVVAFRGQDDASFPREDVEQWEQISTGPFHLHAFSGGHFFIDPHRDAVLALIGQYCRRYAPALPRASLTGAVFETVEVF